MSDNDSEFATIRPSDVALSHKAEQASPDVTSGRPSKLVVVVISVLALIAAWVFFVLPGQVGTPVVERPATPPASPSAPAAGKPATTAAPPAAAPFQSLKEQRAREKAQQSLSRFVELQIRLEEDMNVAGWGAADFDAAQALANEGDELFTAQKFEEAIARYDTGSKALEALVAQGEARFQTALDRGTAALGQRDGTAAGVAFAEAAAVYPSDPRVISGLERAERLPDVLQLWDSANRHRTRAEWDEALADLAAIRELDAETTGLDQAISEVRGEIAERNFQVQVSEGYAALDAGRFDAALKAFNRALAMRPGDPAATDGRKQAQQGRTLSRIDRLRAQAESQAASEDWTGAEKAYAEVLAVDSSLKFARDGREEATRRQRLDDALQKAIANPDDLSSDETFAETVALFQKAVEVDDPGPRLTAQLDRLESILAVAAEPVRLTLVSDNATEVKIYQIGDLGRFDRKDVQVRPGRYVITGSRDGCRDVRKEVTVTPNMAPVDIRCQERI